MKETRKSKHEKLCLGLSNCKSEKGHLEKKLNKVSVAFESSKKAYKDSHKIFEQKVLNYEKEIIKLNHFKTEKLADEKKINKAAKKTRQREQKDDTSKDTKVDLKTENNLKNLNVTNTFDPLQKLGEI